MAAAGIPMARSGERRLEGRVAIVTGGGTGIGRAIAVAFVAAGAQTVIVGRSAETLNDAAADAGAVAMLGDAASEADMASVFAEVARQFGGLDILVNNAGASGPIANAEDMDMAAWDEAMRVNVRTVMVCTRAAVPLMRARGGGAIVNMSSLMGLRGYPMRAAYSAAKFAVIGITEAVAQEVGNDNIRVNALCPGAVSGELMDRVIARRAAAEGRSAEEIIRENYTDKAALRRWVDPEEVAEAALFLASDAAKAITGERLRVDAGRM
jgi:NAD(P)-dependent dehydrogenase (short-subunit alcohol dehydrogenase family)